MIRVGALFVGCALGVTLCASIMPDAARALLVVAVFLNVAGLVLLVIGDRATYAEPEPGRVDRG